jgi:hypothetical protein
LKIVADRIDQVIYDDLIMNEMHKRIQRAVIVVADLTGGNPNVMYELGYAKALGKKSVLISNTPPEKLPFDMRGWPILIYGKGQIHKLREQLVLRLRDLL